jgi:hypothetical protein
MMRRDSSDEKWSEVKKQIFLRDKERCRLIKICSPKEFLILKKNAGNRLFVLDPAHVIAASQAPNLLYESENIICLNRFSHSCLDNCCNPLSGEPISKIERNLWWKRIIGETKFTNLEEMQRSGN